jgi:hypothetical protein
MPVLTPRWASPPWRRAELNPRSAGKIFSPPRLTTVPLDVMREANIIYKDTVRGWGIKAIGRMTQRLSSLTFGNS